jgi:predicted dehydrogenase
MSRRWVEIASAIDDFELVGFVDIYEDAARARAESYGKSDIMVSTDLAATLKATQPDIVFDVTVPTAHTQVALTAFEHGAHLLAEKPMADSLDNARKTLAAAQAANRIYSVMQNRRFDPNIQRVRALLDSGEIGPLTTLNSDFFVGAHFGGFRDHIEHVLLLDMAIHTFDAARFISRADPVAVYCHEWNPAGSWYDQDSSAIAIFEMSNGIVYTYRGSWCSEGLRTTWECDWRIIGQQGTITWQGDEQMAAQKLAGDDGFFRPTTDLEFPAEVPPQKTGGHDGLIREYVEVIRSGGTPETLATDNIKSLAMVFGAIESAETGQRVKISW